VEQPTVSRGSHKRLLALLILLLLIPTGLVAAITQYRTAKQNPEINTTPSTIISPAPSPGEVTPSSEPVMNTVPSTTVAGEAQTPFTPAPLPVSTVSLTDDQTEYFDAASLFHEQDLPPGSSGAACIEVRYTGNASNGVRVGFSIDDTSALPGLDHYLSFTVIAGVGVAYGATPKGTCNGFTPGTDGHQVVVSDASLDTSATADACFTAASSCPLFDYASGGTGSSVWRNGDVTDYEIRWTVSRATPPTPLAEASSDFSWTASEAG
jgi:hypothetical protein